MIARPENAYPSSQSVEPPSYAYVVEEFMKAGRMAHTIAIEQEDLDCNQFKRVKAPIVGTYIEPGEKLVDTGLVA